MENNLSFYKEVAINIFRQKGKLLAVKFLMEKRNSTHSDWNKGLLDCKNLLESWIENKDYIPDEIKLNEYDKLKEERDRYEKAIVSLTPSGSEFVNDPEYCAKHVKEYQASQHGIICNLVIEKKKLKEERDLLIDALRECADDLKRMKRNEASRIETDFDRIEKWAFDTTIKYYCILNDIKNK